MIVACHLIRRRVSFNEVSSHAVECLTISQATVDISSKYKGTVAKIYYKTHDIAFVGKPLVDIRVSESGILPSLHAIA